MYLQLFVPISEEHVIQPVKSGQSLRSSLLVGVFLENHKMVGRSLDVFEAIWSLQFMLYIKVFSEHWL